MRNLTVLMIVAAFCITGHAAKFEPLETNEIESSTFKTWLGETEKVRSDAKRMVDDNGYYYLSSGIYKIHFSENQSELKMIRQFVHFFGGYMTLSDMVDAGKVENVIVNDLVNAILPEAYYEYINGLISRDVHKIADNMFDALRGNKNLVLYTYCASGRAYGNFAHCGIIVINYRTDELFELGHGWSD